MSDEVYITTARECDIHRQQHEVSVQAHYDGRTRGGRWANLCQECFETFGVGLGTGKGQRLIVGPEPARDPARVRSQIQAALSAGDLAMAEDLLGDGDLDDYL